MADRLLIIDSDIFILLASAGLIGRVAALLGVEDGNIRRLEALPHQLDRGKAFKKNYSDAVRRKAVAECNGIAPLIDRPADDALFQLLNEVEAIDEGEALLLALAAENPAYYIASGDKRAMRALAAAPTLQAVRDALRCRIVCLEAVLRLLVTADGVQATAAAFAAVRDKHTTLRVVFSEVGSTDQAQCLQYIDSYLNELIKTIGTELLFKPLG